MYMDLDCISKIQIELDLSEQTILILYATTWMDCVHIRFYLRLIQYCHVRWFYSQQSVCIVYQTKNKSACIRPSYNNSERVCSREEKIADQIN